VLIIFDGRGGGGLSFVGLSFLPSSLLSSSHPSLPPQNETAVKASFSLDLNLHNFQFLYKPTDSSSLPSSLLPSLPPSLPPVRGRCKRLH